ncbi:PEP-CTERM sorting domain-containing protein [Roseofilum sp. Guam]|uniref:PEP-CTERM sorting domain-containing protein n=1 Tax=Roseofilum sp. Guam TaxID=2821502 RepID=UPI001B001647|nr:PEP-CTERM sorting domain-containing protein [Roseofilum sp. Guam]MBP0028162.1 PEP-CTERM sorting domain-containing protein [Roseofilum sp. Guam]
MNSLKTALMFTGGCLSVCLAASPVQSLQLHFQSLDGKTRADVSLGGFGTDWTVHYDVEIDLYQDPTKDPIDSFLKGESYWTYFHNGFSDPNLLDLIRTRPFRCSPTECLFPLKRKPANLSGTAGWGFITQQLNNKWYFQHLGSPWSTYSMGQFSLRLDCASDFLSCVGSYGSMGLYISSTHLLWYSGPMQFVGFTNPTPTPTPTPDPIRVPEPSVVLGLLFLSGLGLLKKRRM